MAHILTEDDNWFIDLDRKDPITHEGFQLGDEVIVCRACRCVQLNDVWEMGPTGCKYCGSSEASGDFDRDFIEHKVSGATINKAGPIRITHKKKKKLWPYFAAGAAALALIVLLILYFL
ncbi:MAG: hypothetical protein IK026_07235 [Eubacteriaceae bacterium]|nr:hypothetical protein [Eubacteriaceae bacterium]MBR5996347.1 hypothetical protein [Eubacteriaceae bacterium]